MTMAASVVLATLVLAGPFAAPARADDDHDHDRRNAPHQQQAHHDDRWRAPPRHDSYDQRPGMYYSAPPVVYQPPVYYQQPGPVVSLTIPFFYR